MYQLSETAHPLPRGQRDDSREVRPGRRNAPRAASSRPWGVRLVMIVICASLSMAGAAEERPLSLAECVRLAVENNPAASRATSRCGGAPSSA